MENNKARKLACEKLKWVDTPFEYTAAICILSLFFGLMVKTLGFQGMICIAIASIITCLAMIQREIKNKNHD